MGQRMSGSAIGETRANRAAEFRITGMEKEANPIPLFKLTPSITQRSVIG